MKVTKIEEGFVVNLSDKILSLRKQNGLSQGELAEKLNVSQQAVSRWEVGSAQPDVSNVLQLSKLFGVTTDYLLNDDYESDCNVPDVKNTEAIPNKRTKKTIALCVSLFGVLGNSVIYILSRFIEVMVPHIAYENGEKWYHWNSRITGHNYKYFVQEYDLEFLTFLLWGLFFAGLMYYFANSDRINKAVINYKEKRRQKV